MDRPRAPLRRPLALALLLVFGAAAPLAAQITLDFEGLPLNTAIAPPYGGFASWGGLDAVAAVNGCASSGSTCATNAFGRPVALDRIKRFRPTVPFGFISAYFTSWAVRTPTALEMNVPFPMAVRGYSGSVVVFSKLLSVPSGRTRISFVWPNLTSLVFEPQVAGWFLMDDFTYVNGATIPPEAVVPEPVTLVLLGSGLAAVCGVDWRRRRRERAALSD